MNFIFGEDVDNHKVGHLLRHIVVLFFPYVYRFPDAHQETR